MPIMMTKTTEVGKVQDKLNKVQSAGLKKAEALAIEFMKKNKEEGKIATNDQIYQCLSKVGKWPTQSRPNISSKPVTGMCLGLVYVFFFRERFRAIAVIDSNLSLLRGNDEMF